MAIAKLLPHEVICIPSSARALAGFRRWARSPEFPEHCRISFLADELYIEPNSEAFVRIPTSALTLAGFRRWAKSPEFPDRGRISFISGKIVIDMSPEELETHNKVKVRTNGTLDELADRRDLGQFYGDRTLVTNPDADLSTEPDGTFVSWQSLQTGRVRLVPREGVSGQYTEVLGSPDMVLEVVSITSVHKDRVELREKYYRAGVREYWLIDARGEDMSFVIFARGRSGFVAVPARAGWVRSEVFGRSFRLERRRGRMNFWRYTLLMKPK